jgi:phosphate transport system substrate-binding protein
MTTLFTGAWQVENSALNLQLLQLKKLAYQEFDIEISIEKMIKDESYRGLVISELSQLNSIKIDDVIKWLTTTEEQASIKLSQKKNHNKTVILSSVIILLSILTIFFFTNSKTNESELNLTTISNNQNSSLRAESSAKPSAEINNSNAHNSLVNPSNATEIASNTSVTPALAPETLLFRLHGSNTIGEKLAPQLLEHFLVRQGASNISWQQGENRVERKVSFKLNNKRHYVELQAHGSSTAFSALAEGKADIGMASRKIKAKELQNLKGSAGKLNGIGNEHIIGLDGLAVIVNQNNPIKSLSTKTLAKIFSGEITNWSQVGGGDKKITLLARDLHSGTWDTFKSLVLKKHKMYLAPVAKRFESSSALSTLVSQNEGAIGFIGLNYVLHNKAIAISATKDTNAIYPTRFTIGTEDYSLSRRLYFYTPTKASDIVKEFAHYAISAAGQDVVAKTGLISQNIQLEQAYPLDNAPKKYNQYTQSAKRLSLNFRFDYATKDLDNKGKRDLQRLVQFMEQHNNRRLVLMGFSDSIGAKLKNQNLALKRAKSVEQALTARGIPVLSVEAWGEALPIANNDTEDGRRRNRRVEVWLL